MRPNLQVLSDDLVVAVAARNARFRTWAALGVPVKGVWWLNGVALELEVHCAECGVWCPSDRWWWTPGMDAEALRHEEEDTIQALVEVENCPHLGALLQPEPEGFAETLALEILAGDPPR